MIGGHTPPVSAHNTLSAHDHAQVGQQVGVQINEVVHHKSIYNTSPEDTPDRMHTVAKDFLDCGNPRRAEDLLRTLHHKGHATTERSYLYVLSILSERSLHQITEEMTVEIHYAMNTAGQRDEWQEALEVINQLLYYAHTEYREGAVEDEFATAKKLFGALHPDRQDEIDTHMSLILSGAEREWLASVRRYKVAAERMSGDRVGRAWKFFEADPRQPRRWVAAPMPSTIADWRDAVLGTAATVLAVAVMLASLTASAVMGVPLLAAGGYAALRCMLQWHTHRRHQHSVWAHHQPQPEPQEMMFDKLVDQCFREGDTGGLWETTAGYREYLKRRLQQQYGPAGCHPYEVKWLVRWHIWQARQGNIYLAAGSPQDQRVSNLRTLGVVMWVAVAAMLFVAGEYAAFLLALGGWWGISGIARLVSVSKVQALLAQDAERVFAGEWAEYLRWVQVLADRPTDPEMGRWLALDKAHLKNEALRRANLRERDLVAYVVLTERAPFARRSRVTGGPRRYEAYMVYIFLLTEYGMRTTRTYLELDTGDTRNDQHQMCTYDAVASASVMENGVRTFQDDGRPSMDRRGSRVFQLVLLNGTCIAEVRENRRATGNEPPEVDDDSKDMAPVLDASFDGALQVMEAVATEGRDWIARDRERKQRWARNWGTRTLSR